MKKHWISKVFMIAAFAFINMEMVEGRQTVSFFNGEMVQIKKDADKKHFNVLDTHGNPILNEYNEPMKVKLETAENGEKEVVTMSPKDEDILTTKLKGYNPAESGEYNASHLNKREISKKEKIHSPAL
jgi:penicillin V acylase-like amidase (Ntn superfamily)